jgi:glycine/D-amino acid oxidase-like deaminating enzyme
VSTQTPEAVFAERVRHDWAERLVLSFLTPSGGFVHPSQMVKAFAAALRAAEKDAARAMRDRAARAVDDYDLDFKTPGCCLVAAERAAERLADLVRSLEV